MRRLTGSMIVLAALFAGCSVAERREERGGKVWTGVDQSGSVEVRPFPQASERSAGFDEQRLASGFDDWEPFVAADRNSAWVYQLVTRYAGGLVDIVLRRSPDSGATWEERRIPRTGASQYDPQIAVDDHGVVYVTWLERSNYSTLFARSFDHGETWTDPIAVDGGLTNGTDHGWLAVSGDGVHVYVAFSRMGSHFVASHDGGETFDPPLRTTGDERLWLHSGGAVAADGTVYFAAADYDRHYRGPTRVGVWSSRDQGATWSFVELDRSAEPPDCQFSPGCEFGFLSPVIGLAVDTSGSLLVAYNAGRRSGEPQRIWVRRSDDRGETWSRPVAISHPDPLANNAFPAVAAGTEPGDFRVVWQGDANGNTTAFNTWQRATSDGGVSWGPFVRLSDLGGRAPYKRAAGYRFMYGDYLGASVDGAGTLHAIWGEAGDLRGPGGCWYTRGR